MTDEQIRRAEQWAADEDAERAYRAMEDEATALAELTHVLSRLPDTAPGRVIADALGVGTMPLPDLARRLWLQYRRLIPTGHIPE